MGRNVKMSHLESALEELSYPVERSAAAATFEDTTLLLADGDINLGGLIANTQGERFESMSDLEAEIHNVLPREAVGEPYQSEGDA